MDRDRLSYRLTLPSSLILSTDRPFKKMAIERQPHSQIVRVTVIYPDEETDQVYFSEDYTSFYVEIEDDEEDDATGSA